jgi:CCR4-NOT transcriptional regulation complex NOT5 subunit
MEKFKACEKEMKTKAFSKEGLIASAKLDPKAQAKQEVTDWVQTQVEALLLQVEQSEAEIESLQGGGKKRGKTNSTVGRLEELEHLNERRKWHISRLEIILRLLDNGSMATERVQDLKEDVNYFVESNTVRYIDFTFWFLTYRGIFECRKRTSKRTKASMTNLTSTRKRRSSVLLQMMTMIASRTRVVMVRILG